MIKKALFAVTLCLIFAMLCTTVFASSESSALSESLSDESEASSEIVLDEPENKNLEWAYWLIGGASLAAVVASAVVISKKVK